MSDNNVLTELEKGAKEDKFKKEVLRKIEKYPYTTAARISFHVSCVLTVFIICGTVLLSQKMQFKWKLEELQAELGQTKVYNKTNVKPRRRR
jgi:hypothetical protein